MKNITIACTRTAKSAACSSLCFLQPVMRGVRWQITLMPHADLDDPAHFEFFRLGTHYYIAGRFAALSGLFLVAGNLMHHAIEMFLKGALVRLVGLDALRDISHDLRKLWARFKERIPSTEATFFDVPIADLHRFERIRYPDNMIREVSQISFSVFRSQRVESSGTAPLSSYTLVLEDVDALVNFSSIKRTLILNSICNA